MYMCVHVRIHACCSIIIIFHLFLRYNNAVPPTASIHRPVAASLSTGAGSRPRRYPTPLVANDTASKGGKSQRTCTLAEWCVMIICSPCYIASGAGHIFVAKERYDAIGARSNRVLSFERGEELEVFNPVAAAEWWEVRSLFLSLSLPI